MKAALASLGLAALALGACGDAGPAAPTDVGVCWHMVREKGEYRFNKVAANQPQLEHCAARLEEMRLRFLRLGGSSADIVGAYQGRFLFLQKEGVLSAAKFSATPYLVMIRTGDGRLAIPGAVAN